VVDRRIVTLSTSKREAERRYARAADPCEHAFPVTSQGHRYAQFERALKTGNVFLAMNAARELRHVDLADALSLLLLLSDDDPVRFDQAAVRWLARYYAEDRRLRIRDAREC
jgi:hypothetical protein